MQIDDQTAAGIEQWCRHFDSVTFYGILMDGRSEDVGSTAWVDVNEGLIGARAKVIALPFAYGVGQMAKEYARVRAELRSAIAAHRHLCFTLGTIIGDWPAVAALEATRQERRFAVLIDRVEPPIIRKKLGGSLVRRLAAEIVLPFAQGCVRYLLRKSSVALLQGGDTYGYYAGSARDPHCVYDTHASAAERVSADVLAAKQARVLSGAPLRIVYVGRAVAMKGASDWIETLHRLHQDHVPFQATWIGDGLELGEMQKRVVDLGLSSQVDLPGFEGNREVLLRHLRDSDLLLFCHKTPESPRCLIEALVCGCPIVGYDTAYPRGLTARRGGGMFTAQNDVAALTRRLVQLHGDRAALAELIADAAASGALYDEDTIYAERAELMRRG